MRKKRTPELDQMVVNRLKFGMSKKEIEQELGLSGRMVDTIYREYGFNTRPIEEKTIHYPKELLDQWDTLHRRYGTCQK